MFEKKCDMRKQSNGLPFVESSNGHSDEIYFLAFLLASLLTIVISIFTP